MTRGPIHTYTLQHPRTHVRLRSRPFPSDLHIGKECREEGDPILKLLRGSRIDPSPYLIRRPARAVSPRSPGRGFREPRRAERASSGRGLAPSPGFPPPAGLPPAMGPAALMLAPVAGPRGPFLCVLGPNSPSRFPASPLLGPSRIRAPWFCLPGGAFPGSFPSSSTSPWSPTWYCPGVRFPSLCFGSP
jgi:hypothetical protein